MKIIAFPFAGGDKHAFNFLKKGLTERSITLTVLECKGRGSRIKEQFSETIEEIVDDFVPKVLEIIKDQEDYIIYGHSMGALVGYLISMRLEDMNVRQPLKLIVSGRRAPSITTPNKVSTLKNDVFWKEIIELGGVPERLLQQTDLLNFFEPIIRADFKVVENYIHNPIKQLSLPIEVLYGSGEIEPESYFLAWKKEGEKKTKFEKLEGNHFFIYDHHDKLMTYFEEARDNHK